MRNIVSIAAERQLVNETIRGFFKSRGFVDVETPIVVASPDVSPNLMPFETNVIEPDGKTHHAALITSPEFSMKKLLGSGLEKIFSITKVFRNNESLGGNHNPEFSMLEWYEQGIDYERGMEQTESLVRAVFKAFERDLPGFARLRVRDAFLDRVGIDLDHASADDLRAACEKHGIHTDSSDTESDLYYRLFLAKIEPELGPAPVFVYDYPTHQAALAALTPDGKYAQRFELYIGGLELCNAFTELTNAQEQRVRFEGELEERRRLGKATFPVDENLLALLPSVRHPTFGNALGIDRLHMLAAGKSKIEDVLLFPAKELFS
jgi:lysyl-tRNA synthetase class 2